MNNPAQANRPSLPSILARASWTNSSEGKLDQVVDQDQQHKITLKTEGKADRTAKGYKFIYISAIFARANGMMG